MPVVYVKEQGAVIRKHGARILVEKDHALLVEIRLRETESVAIFGNVQVTTQALSEFLDRGIPVALYTRHGRLKGHVVPDLSKNVPLRVAQYRMALDEAASLALAKAVVRAKLRNAGRLLADYRGHYPSDTMASACEAMSRAAECASGAARHSELLGQEGSAAAIYFGAFAEMNRSELPFDGRRKASGHGSDQRAVEPGVHAGDERNPGGGGRRRHGAAPGVPPQGGLWAAVAGSGPVGAVPIAGGGPFDAATGEREDPDRRGFRDAGVGQRGGWRGAGTGFVSQVPGGLRGSGE
jgi:hypothetical protein